MVEAAARLSFHSPVFPQPGVRHGRHGRAKSASRLPIDPKRSFLALLQNLRFGISYSTGKTAVPALMKGRRSLRCGFEPIG